MAEHKHMLFLGYGFCAETLVPHLQARGFALSATCRDGQKAVRLKEQGINPILLDGMAVDTAALAGVTHVLVSAPPTQEGDPLLPLFDAALRAHGRAIDWLGYLSTTGVYGDHAGAWIDEDTLAGALGARGQRRVAAEQAWLALGAAADIGVHLFRLAGIYGPYRNQLTAVKNGTARRINKPGQVFSRIHVDDIAQVLMASIARPQAGRAYSLCDDEPAPPQDVVAFAAQLLGLEPPPLVDFERAELSDMARSFYSENKRIANARIKAELGVTLAYPDYRVGLTALFEAGAF